MDEQLMKNKEKNCSPEQDMLLRKDVGMVKPLENIVPQLAEKPLLENTD